MEGIWPPNSLFPGFRTEVIQDLGGEDRCHWLQTFRFRTKGKRRDDLVAFGSRELSRVIYYENPHNREFDEGVEDESQLNIWHPIELQSARFPTICEPVDVTGNGFHDLIMTTDYGESFEALDHFGGRVCWLENFGTDEGDWTRRNIGHFPGLNYVKVGNFSTTYSLQVLALVRSPDSQIHAPLIVFTRPADVYSASSWHVTLGLESVFRSIQDCIVIKGAAGTLDQLVISCFDGLSSVWYSNRVWQHKPLNCDTSIRRGHRAGQLAMLKKGRDCLSTIVCGESNKGGIISLYKKRLISNQSFVDAEWDYEVLDDFSDRHPSASVSDFICADLNGDGVDEIIVSLTEAGQSSGIYCYILQNDIFVKYKISEEPVIKISTGAFAAKDKQDLATLSCGSPQEMKIHHQAYVHSEIKPSVRGSELVFYISRSPSETSEVEVMDIGGFMLSLVVLPPDAFFDIAPDGCDAVKVLSGTLAWFDSRSALVERTRASGLPGCAIPMLVDAPAGDVHSGNEGAVFVRMRPSFATGNTDLCVLNALPSHFPCKVCDYDFHWQTHFRPDNGAEEELTDLGQHLSGFRVCYDDAAPDTPDIAHVHFWAAAPGTPHEFTNNIPYQAHSTPGASTEQETACSIRACLSNPNGEGALLYLPDHLDYSASPPTAFQLFRAKKMILPVMHEHGPIWRTSVDLDNAMKVEYPWHTWINDGKTQAVQKPQRHIWASFDFPFSTLRKEELRKHDWGGCIVC